MAKRIFPGNYVNILTAWQKSVTQAVTGETQIVSGPVGVEYCPGVTAFQILCFAEIPTSGSATNFALRVPSPDAYSQATARPEFTPIVIPQGAVVRSIGLRLTGNITLTTGHGLKVASAEAATPNAVSASAISSPILVAGASNTLAAGQAKTLVASNGTALSSALTVSLFSVNNSGTATGGAPTRVNNRFADPIRVVAEIVYLLPSDIPGDDMLGLQPSGINQTLAINT